MITSCDKQRKHEEIVDVNAWGLLVVCCQVSYRELLRKQTPGIEVTRGRGVVFIGFVYRQDGGVGADTN